MFPHIWYTYKQTWLLSYGEEKLDSHCLKGIQFSVLKDEKLWKWMPNIIKVLNTIKLYT